MPSLTQAQWDAIRRVGSEAARKFIQKNYTPATQELLDLGFHPNQVQEIVRIATATAVKTMKQMDFAAQAENSKSKDELESRVKNLESAITRVELSAMRPVMWDFRCAAEFMAPRPRRPESKTTPTAKNGDRYWQGTEVFTFFRGEWRRRSELESYASAAEYL